MSPKHEEKSTFFKNLIAGLGRVTQGKRSIFSMNATWVTVRISGTEHRIDSAAGLSDEMLSQIASQSNIPLEKLSEILRTSGVLECSQQTSSGLLETSLQTSKPQAERIRRPIATTICSKCHRKVPEASSCLYCGQTLAASASTKQSLNEVDKEFLDADVVEKPKTVEKQRIRDTFEDRLKNL